MTQDFKCAGCGNHYELPEGWNEEKAFIEYRMTHPARAHLSDEELRPLVGKVCMRCMLQEMGLIPKEIMQ